MFGKLFDFEVDTVTAPIRHTTDILEGLSEGEIRTIAALKLGADVAAGMAIEELIEALLEEGY